MHLIVPYKKCYVEIDILTMKVKILLSWASRFPGMSWASRFPGMSWASRFPGMSCASRFPGMSWASRFPGMSWASRFSGMSRASRFPGMLQVYKPHTLLTSLESSISNLYYMFTCEMNDIVDVPTIY